MAVRHVERPNETQAGINIPPLWRESLWPTDWLRLRVSPVYRGEGVPRGDGGPVVVVPGFLGTDAYLIEMHSWLRRVGYRPYFSGVGLNADCAGATARKLTRTVQRAHKETGRRVRIIGHSLGGIIGRKVSLRHPSLVSQLIYLGTPVQRVHAHPAVVAAAAALIGARSVFNSDAEHCLTADCGCGVVQDAEKPLPRSVHHAAIYSRGDGVVDWHESVERDSRRNHEVGGTHIGLVYNPKAYRVLGDLLAQAPAE